MKEIILYALWGCMYILCTGLGFVPNPAGFGKILLTLTSLIFFLPGAAIVYHARKVRDRKSLIRIRWISSISLILTVVVLILNFFSVHWSAAAGRNLYQLLVLVSAPMICSQYWIVSLFLWACMLTASFQKKHP